MEKEIKNIQDDFLSAVQLVNTDKDLEKLRIRFLGKKGEVASLMQDFRLVPKDQRPQMGGLLNTLKTLIEDQISDLTQTIQEKRLERELSEESVDISLPGREIHTGSAHPLSQMLDEVHQTLIQLGFSFQECPEIEEEYYNYGGLNYPPDHPARDMQDTFYLDPKHLLRSHTTSIQQHVMELHAPPLRVFSSGKCYRNETITSRSHVLFHQVDVLYIDKGVSFSDLLSMKEYFYSKIFNQKVELRVRPSYFPFVEPGMEVDIKCTRCKGNGCVLCKQAGWLEVAGAGMVHPRVLIEGGLDPEVYSGYAWGGGIERLFMLRHEVNDIRLFTDNNMEFLSQFHTTSPMSVVS